MSLNGTDTNTNRWLWMAPATGSSTKQPAGYVSTGQSSQANACSQTNLQTQIFSNNGSLTVGTTVYSTAGGGSFNGGNSYYGFNSGASGSNAVQSVQIDANGQVTALENCSTHLAGYLTLPAGSDIGNACSNSETSRQAVYTSDGKIGYGRIFYTDDNLSQVFNGSWQSYGFAPTLTGNRTRSFSIDGSGVSFRYAKCPFVYSRTLAGYITAGATTAAAVCNQSATNAVYTDDGNIGVDAILYRSQTDYDQIVVGDGKYYGFSSNSGGSSNQTLLISNGNVTAVANCGGGGQARINVISEPSSKVELRVYPNPAREYVMLEGLRQLPGGTVGEIIDANGRTIQKIRLNTDRQRIDTKTWNKGIYLVRILDSKGGLLLTKKLIIQ